MNKGIASITAAAVLAAGLAFNGTARADDARRAADVQINTAQTQTRNNGRTMKQGMKEGLKYGLKNGLKNGMKRKMKNGLKNGEKR
ncbi:MAG: hypothetical protein IJU44_08390 [Kiritimatiellae bacterium]|nr:hypothetical protein [Kiritimatiellia bacterium]